MSVRFLHAADLHLGLRLTRFEKDAAARIAEARFVALESLKTYAKTEGVKFIVVAGDLFDDNSIENVTSARAFTMLEGSGWPGPVFIIPGNHDPLTPGCVWDRDPWTREQPHKRVRVLREPAPVALPELGVTLFPCPLRHRTSVDDPTRWIEQHPRCDDPTIRIGIAHGSLKDRPNLPADDHLIALDAADRLGLDYLALGHWHKRLVHRDRTVYTGTHEPMRFPNESPRESTGWVAYSDDGDDDRFADGGVGNAILVEIAGPGAIPKLADFNVGRLTWQAESIDLTGRRVGELERDFSQRPNFDRIVMKLRLFGMTDPQSHRRLDEFKNIVLGRYHAGSEFDADAVMIQPEAEQLRAAVGEGVLARVLERLQTESTEGDAKSREIAEHALKHLYRLAFEDQPA